MVIEDIKFEQYEIIKADNDIIGTPIKEGYICIYLGEIPNMKGHIVFVFDGKIYYGFHLENFIKLTGDEL